MIRDELIECETLLKKVIDNIDKVEDKEPLVKRLAQNEVTFCMFKLVDLLGKTEIDIYNYLRRTQ
jgi:hypothetical protein